MTDATVVHAAGDGNCSTKDDAQLMLDAIDDSGNAGDRNDVPVVPSSPLLVENEATPVSASPTSPSEQEPEVVVDDSAISIKRKRVSLEEDAPIDLEGEDEVKKQFSAAQVRVKMKRARLEAQIAAEEDRTKLRFALLEMEQKMQTLEQEKQQAEKRQAAIQDSMDEIVKQHQRTLNGMRDNLKLETLVASLEKEKALRDALQHKFQLQSAELLQAQRRIDELNEQIAKYQKTETVLAQSISHFQHQFSTKDQQRAAQIDRVKHELESQHAAALLAVEEELGQMKMVNEQLKIELAELQQEHTGLQASAQAVLEMQEKQQTEESDLRAKVAKLETEKAVLVSKAEQVQKADAQLRSKMKAQEEQVQALMREKELLQQENQELGKIASDLMDMAEKQQLERERLVQQPDKEGEEKLKRTRTRLRESLG